MSTEAATDGGVEAIAVAVDRVGGGGDAWTARFASFVSRFRPDAAAREAYAAHTKRAHDGNVEEFRLFFEIDERAAASAPRAGDRRRAAPGLVHCTLPTRVRAPTPRSHVDGPFMLSASRGVLWRKMFERPRSSSRAIGRGPRRFRPRSRRASARSGAPAPGVSPGKTPS